MAESERLKGNRPPVADYKIGNGGVRDLLRYILGYEETRSNMKIVKTVKNKKTVVEDTNQKNAIVSKVARAMDSNKVSLLAGEEAARKSNRMASVVNQRPTRERITGADISNRLRMAATYPPNMYNNTNNTNEFGSVVVPSPEEVTVEEMPESEEDLMERLNEQFIPDITDDPVRRRISEQEQMLIDDKKHMYFLDQGYIPQAMAYGGKVQNKKKKKKKAKKTYGKSYNYS